MTEVGISNASARRVAHQIVDQTDIKRREVLKTLPSDFKYKVVEEMVNIRLSRLRGEDGTISPSEVSER